MSVNSERGNHRVVGFSPALICMVISFWTSVAASPPADLDKREIVNALLGKAESSIDDGELWHQIIQLESADRQPILLQLVKHGDGGVVTTALLVMRQKEPDCFLGNADVLVMGLRKWSSATQSAVLQQIALAGLPEELRRVPREVLRIHIANQNTNDISDYPMKTPVDAAALLLARNRSPLDVDLLRETAAMSPSLYGPWLALSRVRGLDEELTDLAQRVVSQETYSDYTRVAAAIALSPHDRKAEQFVVERTRAFLDEFAHQDLDLQLLAVRGGTPKEQIPGFEHYARYDRDLIFVNMLFFLETNSAEAVTFEYLRSEARRIRMALGLIAAIRWPERLLTKLGREPLPEIEPGESDRLLGALVWYNPELRDRAIAVASQERIENELKRLGKALPATAFGPQVGHLLVGW